MFCNEKNFLHWRILAGETQEGANDLRKWIRTPVRLPGAGTLGALIGRYTAHDISQQGAALAYYLLFTLFPLLIFLSSLIGQLHLDTNMITETLAPVLPDDVLALTQEYLRYAYEHTGASTLWFGAVFSIWFPMRATFCLMRAVRLAYGLGEPEKPLRHAFKVVFFTVTLLFCLILTLLLMTLGGRIVAALLPRIWRVLRFAVLGVIVFGALSALYAAAQDKPRRGRAILPGAALATFSWIVLSFGYSVYAENFANYSVVYGALSAIIVLMIWLYLTALTLILGAEVNHTILNTPPAQ